MDNVQSQVESNNIDNDALLADLLGDTVPPARSDEEIEQESADVGDGEILVDDSNDGVETASVEAAESVEAPAVETPAADGVTVAAIETADGVELVAIGPAAEAPAVEAPPTTEIDAAIVESAIAQVEAKEQREEAYAEQPGAPIATEEDVKKAKGKKGAKVAKEKPASKPRLEAGAKPVERVRHVLGAAFDDTFVLDASEVNDLPAAVAANTEAINKAAKKVAEKAVQLFGSVQKGSVDNMVMRVAFKLLKAEGKLTSGDEGNLQKALADEKLSLGTRRSQANQIFMLFPLLKITKRSVKNTMTPNEDSTIWARVQGFPNI